MSGRDDGVSDSRDDRLDRGRTGGRARRGMVRRLVWSSLARRPGRSALLLAGYALGVGVTVALLSIGDALVEQSRDRDLLGGGDLLVLPAGIDLETLKTGGVGSLYFSIERAGWMYGEVLSAPRFAARVAAGAPWLDDELLHLRWKDTSVAVSAGGEIPSLSDALGVGAGVTDGRWVDGAAGRAWAAPSDSLRLARIDAFHLPGGAAAEDSTWAEWHYFNLVAPDGDWWLYLTYMVGGRVPDGRWGGRLLATLVEPGRADRHFESGYGAAEVLFHTDRPDLRIGPSRVRVDGLGRYYLSAVIPAADGSGDPAARTAFARDTLRLELRLEPEPRRWLPPVDVSPGGFTSGYVVPVLAGRMTGRVCPPEGCREVEAAPGYHDHNWGVWSDVTWDWGQARAGDLSILYGGVRRHATEPGGTQAAEGRRFLFAVDSLGLRAVLPVRSIAYEIRKPDEQGGRPAPPAAFRLEAGDGDERLVMTAAVDHARVSRRSEEDTGPDRFVQMRGAVEVSGRLQGEAVEARGEGFFETWLRVRSGDPDLEELRRRIAARLARTGATYAVAMRDLRDGREILLNPDLEFHAASMMKVPVMVRLHRMSDAGALDLDAPVPLRNAFRSILDGSPYALTPDDDSDSTLYEREGGKATVRELVNLMIARSSNLATNLLIDLAGPDSIAAMLSALGADGMKVLRGVEDIPAYRAGLNNTTTARGLLELFAALAEGRAAGPAATRRMLETLKSQEFADAIPAGLPQGTPVAHKTGWIRAVDHDGGIVFPPDGEPYVLVVLTSGVEDESVTRRAAADVSRLVWEWRTEGGGAR
ncbi:MAG: serine hydrolase [Gemmatimonadota bacterium]|nr:serine hydrolase [Gemmatimonadota bacterium]